MRQNRSFRLLWIAEWTSLMGSWFSTVAIAAMVYHYTGAALATGLVISVQFLPKLFISIFAGVVADRYDRRLIMLVSDLIMTFLTVCLLLADTHATLWLVYPLTFAISAGHSFFYTARYAWLPDLVKLDELSLAYALGSFNFYFFQALSGLLAGGVVTWFGWEVAIVLDALSFLISAFCTFRVKLKAAAPKSGKGLSKPPFLRAFQEGAIYLKNSRLISVFFAVELAGGLVSGGISVAVIYFALKFFNLGQGGAGYFYTIQGIGSILAVLTLVPFLNKTNTKNPLLQLSLICLAEGVAVTLLGISPFFWLSLVLYGVYAMVNSSYSPLAAPLLIKALDDEVRGRVMALTGSARNTTLGLASLLFGGFIDWFGVQFTTMALGLFFVFVAAIWFWAIKSGYLVEEAMTNLSSC